MAANESSPLQSFYRLVIMAGSAVVGGMALQVYGPPPEQLGPMIERAKVIAGEVATEAVARFNGEPAAEIGPSVPPTAPAAPAAPMASAPIAPVFSPAPVAAPPRLPSSPPTGHRAASIQSALASDPTLTPLVAQLEAAGVEQLELAPWGADGRLVRGSCTAPRPGSVFRAMHDAIGASPRVALAGLLSRLQAGEAIAQAY